MTSVTTLPIRFANNARPTLVYALMIAIGIAAFLYPFWIPADALPNSAHAGDAPLIAAAVAALVVVAVALEVRRGTMNGATVAVLGVLAANAGLLRLLTLPGRGSGIFFLVVLAGAAFGPRFGMLLGFCAMAVSAIITGGIGPWLPFQMLALAWIGACAGIVGLATSRLSARSEVIVLAAFGWVVGLLYGALMNLWFWPFQRGGGDLSWEPGMGAATTIQHYWSFYVTTSFAWDAGVAMGNAILILLTGVVILRTLRRFAHRLDPVVELEELHPQAVRS
ncbi:MAG: ECF transporter S component [Acidimicrobiia bacterium]|nr:ECF transporter S component [Acidimicrobiia bacterium]